jgi:acylphosphatase
MTENPEQDHAGNVRLTARVEGIVQAVGFRYWTRRKADELGLTGTVRNDDDGSVAVVVEGAQPVVLEFLNWLRSGKAPGRVENVEDAVAPATGEFKEFRVVG